MGTFADDTVIRTCYNDVLRASSCLQEYLIILQRWLHTWKIKINLSKQTYFTFTLWRDPSPPIYLNNVEIPPATTVKYLGLHLDNKRNWKEHIIKKRKQMDLRHKELYWLLGRSSPLSVGNKLLLYKSLIAPIWTYGIELWGCACKSNIAIIEMPVWNTTSNCWRPIVCQQCYDPRRPRYSNRAKSHPCQKYQAPYKTSNSLEHTTPPYSTR